MRTIEARRVLPVAHEKAQNQLRPDNLS
jgi:hypothetical protein